MNPDHEKELWQIRFRRILELEEESFDFYRKLLREKSEILEKAGVKATLQQILQDEGRHVGIAKELMRLVSGKFPKSGRPS